MTATIPQVIPKDVSIKILHYIKSRKEGFFNTYNTRAKYEFLDRQYLRQVDKSIEQARAKHANDGGDPTKFQNIILPIIMPQIESAVTYQAEVFLSGLTSDGSTEVS